jgi:hypothetical protein
MIPVAARLLRGACRVGKEAIVLLIYVAFPPCTADDDDDAESATVGKIATHCLCELMLGFCSHIYIYI